MATALATMPRHRLTAQTYRDEAGDVRMRARRVVLEPFPRLTCSRGHAMRGLSLSLRESTACCHASLHGGRRCGEWFYVVSDWVTQQGHPHSLVVSVTADEIQRMRHFSIEQRLAYLGVALSD